MKDIRLVNKEEREKIFRKDDLRQFVENLKSLAVIILIVVGVIGALSAFIQMGLAH